jgi:hypothetical protein
VGDAFAFTPTATSMDAPQPRVLTNPGPGGEGFYAGNFTENLETHGEGICRVPSLGSMPPEATRHVVAGVEYKAFAQGSKATKQSMLA